MRARVALAAALWLGVGAASPTIAHACSMAPGYEVPTNLELAAQADTIVLATITGERPGKEPWEGAVLTEPTLLLKGSVLPKSVELSGAYLATGADMDRLVAPSPPRELREPNPGAMIGGCVRYVFAPRTQLVLFLKRDEGGRLTPFRSSFSRDAEDVSGPNALWVKAVREYAAVSAAPPREWRSRLRDRIAALRAAGDDDGLAIAADMEVELAGKRLPAFD